jgi:hypothetical protein
LYIGFFAYRLFAYRLFVHDCLLFVISAFCHIGFLFYRLIDIGFLTVGFFRSAFDLESIFGGEKLKLSNVSIKKWDFLGV